MPLVLVGRMQYHNFCRFRQSRLFSARDKNTVFQKHTASTTLTTIYRMWVGAVGFCRIQTTDFAAGAGLSLFWGLFLNHSSVNVPQNGVGKRG